MKLTLLDIVQDILSSMDSTEVNSINDTVESQQVAKIVKSTYYDVIDRLQPAEHFSVFELEATDSTTPTVMTLPSDVDLLLWIMYDERGALETIPEYKKVYAKPLNEFIDDMYALDTTADEFDNFTYTFNGDSFDVFCYNNKSPDWYTVIDDDTIIFDSYDSSADVNLQNNKTLCYGKIRPSFTLSDLFTPNLDANQFTLLLNEAKRQCFMELKNTANPIVEQRAKRAWIRSQHNKKGAPTRTQYDAYPNYGRKV